jgi:hypothetical protein
MDHETRMAFQRGHECPYFRCPYQATVMNMFENSNRITVLIARRSIGKVQEKRCGTALDWLQ